MSATTQQEFIPSFSLGSLDVHPGPSFVGIGLQLIVLIALILIVRRTKMSSIRLLFISLYEQVFDFFEDILGKAEQYRVKSFVVTMFFVILFSNVMGVLFELFGPIFGIDEVGHPLAGHYFAIPTADLNFNIALATLSVVLMIFLQWKHGANMTFEVPQEKIKSIGAGVIYLLIILAALLGLFTGLSPLILVGGVVALSLTVDAVSAYLADSNLAKGLGTKSNTVLGVIHAIHDYLPVMGKNILAVEKGEKPWILFLPIWLLVKVFDVTISLFLGILEIIGLFAKILSLSFRLYGNMIAGGILLGILLVAMASAFENMIGFKVTAVAPVLVYLQSILVALIQALVFPLLVAIFFKVAQTGSEA